MTAPGIQDPPGPAPAFARRTGRRAGSASGGAKGLDDFHGRVDELLQRAVGEQGLPRLVRPAAVCVVIGDYPEEGPLVRFRTATGASRTRSRIVVWYQL